MSFQHLPRRENGTGAAHRRQPRYDAPAKCAARSAARGSDPRRWRLAFRGQLVRAGS
jgi:hypothetical protein